ncbi:MAG: hypothetical protein HWQ44_15060 [Nostoc sp. JL34]|uniref:hypothetical protein n=1 Tax=Nostoc sp. JL34 TaxID=2815397 RepID=UPI001D1D2C9C|nr:hypothetical protein [Nostoc sp. JL34]MBN3884246.1 hypothetical protein [Nostoc sp. JL34]
MIESVIPLVGYANVRTLKLITRGDRLQLILPDYLSRLLQRSDVYDGLRQRTTLKFSTRSDRTYPPKVRV